MPEADKKAEAQSTSIKFETKSQFKLSSCQVMASKRGAELVPDARAGDVVPTWQEKTVATGQSARAALFLTVPDTRMGLNPLRWMLLVYRYGWGAIGPSMLT